MTLAVPQDISSYTRLVMFGVMIDNARESLARAIFLMEQVSQQPSLSDSSATLAKACMDLQTRVETLLR